MTNPSVWANPDLYKYVDKEWNQNYAEDHPRLDVLVTMFIKADKKALPNSVNVDFIFQGGRVKNKLTMGLFKAEKPPLSLVIEGPLKKWDKAVSDLSLDPLKMSNKAGNSSEDKAYIESVCVSFFTILMSTFANFDDLYTLVM